MKHVYILALIKLTYTNEITQRKSTPLRKRRAKTIKVCTEQQQKSYVETGILFFVVPQLFQRLNHQRYTCWNSQEICDVINWFRNISEFPLRFEITLLSSCFSHDVDRSFFISKSQNFLKRTLNKIF